MRYLLGIILLLGAGLAAFAAYETHRYIMHLQQDLAKAQSSAPSIDMVDVLVSRVELTYGQELTRYDVQTAPYPIYAVPSGAFTEIADLFPDGTDTRVVLRAIDPLEAILPSKLTSPGTSVGITSLLAPGKRAVTLAVNQISGVAGFLRPGDRVDIFWTGRHNDGQDITRLIETQMRIIAVNQSANMDRMAEVAEMRTVTVEATPSQAAALAQAQGSGTLTLALMGLNDRDAIAAIDMTHDRMLGIVRETYQGNPAQTCQIRTRRGNELGLVEIPCTN
ncbi:MAG: Flp pilus assembly protein CpaB [Roseinatronobacter sp.]